MTTNIEEAIHTLELVERKMLERTSSMFNQAFNYLMRLKSTDKDLIARLEAQKYKL